MNHIELAKKEGRGYYTSVDDPAINFSKRGLNSRSGMVSCGVQGDTSAPLIGVIWVNPGPGDPLRGRHLHHGDCINLVVKGSMRMDGDWLRPGQAKFIPSQFKYGDAISNEEGVMYLEIFQTHAGAIPDFDEKLCQDYYNEIHGNLLDGL